MRLTVLMLFMALPGLAAAEGVGTLPNRETLRCESNAPRADRLDIVCPLDASGPARRFRFTARFSGSHDDTTASLTPSVNGRPVVCEQGSKTRLTGEEEGDVALECRFELTPAAGASEALRVVLAWHHAQYVDFEFGRD